MPSPQLYSWITSVSCEEDVEKVQILAASLRRVKTFIKMLVLVNNKISMGGRHILRKTFDLVIDLPNNLSGGGGDEDLKVHGFSLLFFTKCVYLSPNTLVVRNCDDIFDKYKSFAASSIEGGESLSIFLFTPELRLYEELTRVRMDGSGKEFNKRFIECVKTTMKDGIEVLERIYTKPLALHGGVKTECNPGTICIVDFIFGYPTQEFEPVKDFDSDDKLSVSICVSLRKKLQARKSFNLNFELESKVANEPIAIVGLSFRLPGGNNPDDFWNFLESGGDALCPIPSSRASHLKGLYPWKDDKVRAGFLPTEIDEFDSKFFNISGKDCVDLDPQQRLLHEVSWEALEDGGINPQDLYSSQTGIFVGSWIHNYRDICMKNVNLDNFRVYMGNSVAATSARLSHFYGCTGPSISTESGCSSSIVAVDMACKSLRLGESSMALACGVNIIIHPFTHKTLEVVISPSYRCKTFDAEADGFARGEGVGVLVLKRLSDAIRQENKIWGLIRGSGVVQEGLSKSLGTPTIQCEALAMTIALEDAGVKAGDVSYVETHGTGTPVGDPMEIAAINKAYYSHGRQKPLVIGSVKTNIGHTEAMSGIAGIIKVILALQKEKIPKHLNLTEINPHIDLEKIPLLIPTETMPWRKSEIKRLGGVSSFGISGTDGHVIIEEAPEFEEVPQSDMERSLHIMKISAKCPESFEKLVESYEKRLSSCSENFADIAYSANTGRGTFSLRAAISAKESSEAGNILKQRLFKIEEVKNPSTPLCFIFSGQGSEYLGMGLELYSTSPIFRHYFDLCDSLLQEKYSIQIKPILFGTSNEDLVRWMYCQVSIFIVEYSLYQLLLSWGITPDYVMGHSLGEFVAAIAAGILSLEDALSLVVEPFIFLVIPPPGKMLIIKASRAQVEQEIVEYQKMNPSFWADFSAFNSPHQSVIAGDPDKIDEFGKFLSGTFKMAFLPYQTAYHNRHISPWEKDHVELASKLKTPPKMKNPPKYISCLEGKIMEPEDIIKDKLYWVRHMRHSVDFLGACKSAQNEGITLFLEIGANPVQSALIKVNIEGATVIPTLRRQEDNWKSLLNSCEKLYLSSWKGEINWKGFDRGYSRKQVSLPFYPFTRKKIWVKIRPQLPEVHPLIGTMVRSACENPIFEKEITLKNTPFVQDHVIGDHVIFPGAGFLEMCLTAGYSAGQGCSHEIPKPRRAIGLKDLKILAPLPLHDLSTLLQTIVKLEGNQDGYHVTVNRQKDIESSSGTWTCHAEATFLPVLSSQAGSLKVDISAVQKSWKKLGSLGFYEKISETGLKFGPLFQTLSSGWEKDKDILLQVIMPYQEDFEDYLVHPVIADGMIQAIMLSLSRRRDFQKKLHVPVTIGEFVYFKSSSDKERFIFVSNDESGQPCCKLVDSSGSILCYMGSVQFIPTSVKLIQGMISQGETSLPKIWEEVWRPIQGPLENTLDPEGSSLAPDSSLNSELVKFNEVTLEEKDFYDKLCSSTLEFFQKALYTCGWKPEVGKRFTTEDLIESLKLEKCFSKYISYYLRSLGKAGILQSREKENGCGLEFWLAQLPQTQQEVGGKFEKKFEKRIEYQMTLEVGLHLPKILQGVVPPLSILFHEDPNKPNVSTLYKALGPWVHDMGSFINENTLLPVYSHLVENFQKGTPSPPIRMLEVGAGTGAFTRKTFEFFDKHKIPLELHFTDISPSFFGSAQKEFEKYGGSTIYKKFDMESDPLEQNFIPEYFDIIVACEVLHVSKDLRKTLGNLRRLLKPGGWIQIVETIKEDLRTTFVFGLLEGFWRFEDYEIRPYHPILSEEKWRVALEQEGFEQVTCTPAYFNVHGIINAVAKKGWKRKKMGVGLSWMIFEDEGSLGKVLREKLEDEGRQIYSVKRSQVKEECEAEVKIKVEALTIQSLSGGKTLEGIIYLWGLHSLEGRNQAGISLPFLSLCQLIIGMKLSPKVFVVTQGNYSVNGSLVDNPSPGTLNGMIRSLHNECGQLSLSHFDLSLDKTLISQSDEIFWNLWKGKSEICAFREGKTLHPKLAVGKLPNDYLSLPHGCQRFQLELKESRQISDLEFTFLPPYTLEGDEIEVEVKAVGLNFRDVFTVLKPIKEFETFHAVGLDFAGVVTKVGSSVLGRKVGDKVLGMRMEKEHPLPSHVKVKEYMVFDLPERMTFAEGATLPAVLATNIYSLLVIAKMKAGERILVHAASGGVGQCAIQLAKYLGVEVIATAGSLRKRNILKNLGVTHVFNSRSIEFEKNILKVTNGLGVDIILNSLTGPGFKEASLNCLGKNGRFVELSVINIWSSEDVQVLRPDVLYKAVNLTMLDEQELLEMRKGMDIYLKDVIRPIPYERFDGLNIRSALSHLQKAKHVGKVVCIMPEVKVDKGYFSRTPMFNLKSTYLVTGGLGGIGWEMVKWILSSGGNNVAIASRSFPKGKILEEIKALNEGGNNIKTFSVDIGDSAQCRKLFEDIQSEFEAPLRGVMHCAGVLSDGIIENQNWSKFEYTFNPKVSGSWNLHDNTKNLNLEHFLLFSSFSATLGSPAQTNHSASNSFKDALTFYRNSIGLPATTVNWGTWGEVGVATEIDFPGVRPISNKEAIVTLEMMMRTQVKSLAVCNIDSFPLLTKLFPTLTSFLDDKMLLGSDQKSSNVISRLDFWTEVDNRSGKEEKLQVFKNVVKTTVNNILNLEPSNVIDDHGEFSSMGIDSLMMIEMKNELQAILGTRLVLNPAFLLDCGNCDSLANKLLELVTDEDIQVSTVPSMDELEQLIREDSQLHEDIFPGKDILPAVNAAKIKTILVTGVTGNFGPYILRELSKRPSITKIYCLIRPSKVGPEKKLTSRLEGVHLLEQVDMGKVTCLQGDITLQDFGLGYQDYFNLAEEVDAIIHCATRVDHTAKYWKAPDTLKNTERSVNVLGTQNVLKFACFRKLKHLCHTSTLISVTTITDQGALTEEWQDVNAFDGLLINPGYPVSKHISEQLVRQGVQRGIPCKVFRLPLVAGDSISGRCDFRFNHLLLRLLAFMKLRCIPYDTFPVVTIPVDICAKDMIQVFLHDEAPYDVYNMANKSPDLEQMIIPIAQKEFGIYIESVSLEEFLNKLNKLDEESPLSFLKTLYQDETFNLMSQATTFCGGTNLSENRTRLFTFNKMSRFIPQYQEKLESSTEVATKDLLFLKETGVFRLCGIENK